MLLPRVGRMTSFTIRPATETDAPAIHDVIAAAFGDRAEVADLWDEVVRRGHDRGVDRRGATRRAGRWSDTSG